MFMTSGFFLIFFFSQNLFAFLVNKIKRTDFAYATFQNKDSSFLPTFLFGFEIVVCTQFRTKQQQQQQLDKPEICQF